jgi:zinc transport system substrate-binding protein
MSEGIALIGGTCSCHSYDRHIWLSARQAKIQAQTIAASLIKAYPEYEVLYKKNLEGLLGELEALDLKLTAMLEPIKGETLLVSHPAFGYFCKDYDLRQISVEHEGKDPLPQHIASILEEARHSPIRSVLLQPQYNNKGAELIAKSLNIPTFTVDPYSSDYVKMMESLGEAIIK